MKILICNAGSTSIKYQLINMDDERSLSWGRMERVGTQEAIYSHKDVLGTEFKKTLPIPDYKTGISMMLEQIVGHVVASLEEISCVGFKVVHAKGVTGVQYLDDKVLAAMAEYNSIAPAHNPPYINAVLQFRELMPQTPMIGSFETGFHRNMPPKAYLYSVPYEYYEKYGIRRYGFHGASHEYLATKTAELLGTNELRLVSCHLGGSGSLSAVKNGQSLDNTLGFSLQSGILHNNRCGDIDPEIPLFMMEELGMSLAEVKRVMSKESGLLGISGVSNDLRDVEEAAEQGNERCRLAIESYAYQIKKTIGGYAVAMGGLDAIVFGGGIGENSPTIRSRVCEDMEFLGVKLDDARNRSAAPNSIISTDDSRVKVLVVATNEEIIVARKAKALLESK